MIALVVLSLTLSGCAAQRAHTAHAADPLDDWASVIAIPRKAPVRVTRDYDLDGRLDGVTDSTLTILVPPDMHPLTISRARVARVAVLIPKKLRWGWLRKPLAVGMGRRSRGWTRRRRHERWQGRRQITRGLHRQLNRRVLPLLVFTYPGHEWRVVYVRP